MALTPKQQRFVDEYLIDLNATQAAIRAGYELIPCEQARGYYVYALVDPQDHSIFYVGKGSGSRYACHYAEWKAGRASNAAKFARISSMALAGCEPIAFCLCDSIDEPKAYAQERAFIAAIGLDHLTNAAPGQTSEHEKTVAVANEMLRRIKPFKQWFGERPRTEHECTLYWKVVAAYQELAAGNWRREITAEVI